VAGRCRGKLIDREPAAGHQLQHVAQDALASAQPAPPAPLNVLPVPAIPCPAASNIIIIITAAGRRLRRRLLRRPAEQHPLQHRETSAELLQLSVTPRIPLQKTRDLLPQPRDLRPLPLRQLPVRLQSNSQRITGRCPSTLRIHKHACRDRRAAQQTS
jgi:hypothetical protein